MYDPLVVDTFTRVYMDIVPELTATTLPGHVLTEITSATQAAVQGPAYPCLEDIAASADEMLTLYDLGHALAASAGQWNVSDTGDIIDNHLRRLIPYSQSILFLYDSATDELSARHARGHASSVVIGLRIPLGHRLSGWVAANRHTIVNSDPTLDLGDVARTVMPRLRSSLSACLIADDQLIGDLVVEMR
jgi:hypothetical protein